MYPLLLIAAAGTGLFLFLRKKAPPAFTPSASLAQAKAAPAAPIAPQAPQDRADQGIVDAAFENLQSAPAFDPRTGTVDGRGTGEISLSPTSVPGQDFFRDPGTGLRAPGPAPIEQVEEASLASTLASRLDPFSAFGDLLGDEEEASLASTLARDLLGDEE